jgi:Na+-translocating ferredoxin:NAD+ oxidoreductase subunit G
MAETPSTPTTETPATPALPPKKNYIADAWLVILLGLLFGTILAAVQVILGPIIEENIRRETYDQIPALVVGAISENTVEERFDTPDGRSLLAYKAMDAEGQHCGWVLPGSVQGYADEIRFLVGTDATMSTISGLFILSQKETPGLGDFITGEDFRGQFKGMRADQPVGVTKKTPASNEIRALTGATISSDSVAHGVNQTLAAARAAQQL